MLPTRWGRWVILLSTMWDLVELRGILVSTFLGWVHYTIDMLNRNPTTYLKTTTEHSFWITDHSTARWRNPMSDLDFFQRKYKEFTINILKAILKYAILSLKFQRTQNLVQRFLNFKNVIGVECMAVSYKKLWKLLIDKDMKKKDLCAAAGISHASIAKLGKNENVTTDVLVKICVALQCDIGDIMELTQDTTK